MVREGRFWFAQFADVSVSVALATWVAAYTVTTPASWAANETKTYSIQVTNNGNQTWPMGGPNPVHLGVHFANVGGGAGSNTWYTDQRFNLSADLAPGATATLTISVTAPNNSGNLVLEYQMVKDGQFWFAQFSDANVTVSRRDGRRDSNSYPTYNFSQSPWIGLRRWVLSCRKSLPVRRLCRDRSLSREGRAANMKRIDLRRCVSTGLGAAIFALSAVSAAPVAAATAAAPASSPNSLRGDADTCPPGRLPAAGFNAARKL